MIRSRRTCLSRSCVLGASQEGVGSFELVASLSLFCAKVDNQETSYLVLQECGMAFCRACEVFRPKCFSSPLMRSGPTSVQADDCCWPLSLRSCSRKSVCVMPSKSAQAIPGDLSSFIGWGDTVILNLLIQLRIAWNIYRCCPYRPPLKLRRTPACTAM